MATAGRPALTAISTECGLWSTPTLPGSRAARLRPGPPPTSSDRLHEHPSAEAGPSVGLQQIRCPPVEVAVHDDLCSLQRGRQRVRLGHPGEYVAVRHDRTRC